MDKYHYELIDVFTDNIKALPVEPITIATPDGPQQLEALILGDYALNENSEGWTITHIKSGYGAKSFATPIEALILLGILLGSGMPNDFTIEGFASIPGIRDIAARIKAAIVTLDSWDLDIDYNEPEYAQEG